MPYLLLLKKWKNPSWIWISPKI